MGLANGVDGGDGLFGRRLYHERIGALEREVEQLKDELRRTRMSAGPPTAASNQVRHPADPE